MRLGAAADLGRYLRDRRLAVAMTQQQLAARAGVSRRWLSELESGKPTAEVGLVFKVVAALGLLVDIRPEPEPDVDLDDYLDSIGDDGTTP
ncbi:helix-turn-helix domain-containing protein [Actinoplanes bogorensis]|uniref:Helix-turn-helix domain-containing protein n=1 Tax=Paractinoplanes bogorensis TaxID=1610840 RepID=A0ABS5YVV3_9ACTN|nr:helix-turn-helix domain-containing protein [Actinoplanes bogorensis]MBU2667570.1 helix-turn-helix domain-containing protein [Actinoplanes bogorensis]